MLMTKNALRFKHCPGFRTLSELKRWLIFIYEHIANQNSVKFSVSDILYKRNVNKAFVFITDLTSTLKNYDVLNVYTFLFSVQ